MVDINALNESVMDIVTDFSDEYEATEAVDYATRCANLEAGSKVPLKGGIKLTPNQQHIEEYSYESAEKIRELCNAQRGSVLATMSTAPSEEALRMMQAVSLRDGGVSTTELDAIITKYGDCYQVRKFVSDQMLKRNLGTPAEDECEAALRMIDLAEQVGTKEVKASSVAGSKVGKAARLSVARQQLNGEGLFSIF